MTRWHKFLCNVMGWHRPRADKGGFDGATFTSRCARCSRRIGMDSQGNWFAFSLQYPEDSP